jgi:tetratricopeptide (TPR) repeat protein
VGYRFIAPVERECPSLPIHSPTTTTELLHQPDTSLYRPTAHFQHRGVGRSPAFFATLAFLLLTAALSLVFVKSNRTRVSQELSSLQVRKAGEAYAMGLDSRRFLGEEALSKSKEYLQQAIALDSTFAEAHAQLAITEVLIGDEASPAPKSDYEDALAEARRALDLDPTLPEAHVAFGDAKLRTEWDWDGAKFEYLRALDLNPHSVNALEAYAQFLGATGQNTESLHVIERAQAMDPLSVRIRYDKAGLNYLARDYQQAIGGFAAVAEIEPDFAEARKSLSDAYARAGQWKEASNELLQWLKEMQAGQDEILATQRILYKDGLRELWRMHAHGCTQSADNFGIPFNRAGYSALLGETETTMKWLDEAYEQHDPRLLNLKVDPQFDEVRCNPEFAKFLEKIGLT